MAFEQKKMDQGNDEILVKITDICRACLTRTENMKYLLENSDEILLLLSKFASVSNLEIELGFKYPLYLCNVCEEKIITSYEFQQQCQKSNELVNEYLAVFEKQETALESGSENLSSQELLNITETSNPEYHEVANLVASSISKRSENDKIEWDEDLQEELKNVILYLKQKYNSVNICFFCEFEAANSTALSAHISRIHKESKASWCSLCNKVFSNLEMHLEETHKNDFMCKFCNVQLSNFKSIIKHLYSHQVSNKNSSVKSIQVFQENDNDCHICSISFDSQELLKSHAEKHVITCKFCNKTFLSSKVLQNHKCNRKRRKKNNVFVGDAKTQSNIMQIEGEEKGVDTNTLQEKLRRFSPKQVSHDNKTLQRMRLTQYSIEDVEKAISVVREKFYRHVTCIFCSFTAITNRSLSVHVTRVHRDKKEKWCSSCNQVIENQSNHIKEVHYEDFKCPFCRKIKTNMGHFMEHLASHSTERLHKCDICHKSFISPRHLRTHRKTHSKERPFKCEICEKMFFQAKHLKSHLQVHQSSEKNAKAIKSGSIEDITEDENSSFKSDCTEETKEMPSKPQNFCKDCNKKVRSLPNHYARHHDKTKSANNEKQNLCPHCGKRFKTKSKLNVHIRTHTGETPYKCQFCDKRCKTRNILIVHQRTHTGEKPYMCTVCGKSFSQSSILNTHTRIHTGRPEQCKICEKRFCRPAELRLHLRKHTGEKPFTCDHCGQSFKQKSHLVEHTKTHNDDRPYKCEICEKAFKSSGTLKCHIQIHTGQKPFKCSQCSYACRQPYSLTQHMVQHEIDKPQPDYPHKCQLCQRNFATIAHLTAHNSRYHSNLKEKFQVNFTQPSREIVTSDSYNDLETNQNSENNYQILQENQIEETVGAVETIDTMIIQTEMGETDVKFEPIQIQFTTLQNV